MLWEKIVDMKNIVAFLCIVFACSVCEAQCLCSNQNVVASHYQEYQVPVVYYANISYQPVVVQSLAWTPVVQTKVVYAPVVNGYYETFYLYQQAIEPRRTYNTWVRHNY